MQNIIQVARYMDEFCDVVMIEFEVLQLEKMFDIFKISSNKVVHAYNMKSFPDKLVAQMRSKKSRSTRNENFFSLH